LRRLKVGDFEIDRAVTLDDLRELAASGREREPMISIPDALSRMPKWIAPPEAVADVRNGRLVGSWLSRYIASESSNNALLITELGSPLAIVGRTPTGLWKISRGI
jgi:tRNA U55 pseudouridine synthase TruB